MLLLLLLLFFHIRTSPQRSLSIGFSCSISFLTSSIHLNWSSVSTYGKLSSNCICHGVSFSNANPFIFCLFAYSCIKFFATSCKFDFTFFLVLNHSLEPSLFSFGSFSPPPMYFLILSNWFVGIYNMSSSLYFIFI